jgi:hypothetical protein
MSASPAELVAGSPTGRAPSAKWCPRGSAPQGTYGPRTVHRAGRARGNEQWAGRKAYYQVLTGRLEARVGMGPAGAALARA